MGSFLGVVLHTDLANRKVWREELPPAWVLKYLGGRGINARMLWDLAPQGVNPLGPDNPLIFGAGVLTGTSAPLSGRSTVTTRSPATGWYVKSSVGGHVGAALKFAGYDHLVIHGQSGKPVYILIDDDRVEIRSAVHLWGRDTRQTTMQIHADHGPEFQVACIGPAGENLVKFAAIMCNIHSAAARAGIGAVMGSKHLKAIAIRGRKPVSIADPKRFWEMVWEARRNLAATPSARQKHNFGTAGGMLALNELKANPTCNFRRGYFPETYQISGQRMTQDHYTKNAEACYSCVVACKRHTEQNTRDFGWVSSGGPEFEAVSSLGAGTAISDIETLLKGNELCNILGLDVISTGSLIQWMMENSEHGLLTPEMKEGLTFDWGDSQTLVTMVRKIAYREGIGDVLAEGVRHAAQVIGGDSWKWAIEAKGLEQSRVETRSAKGYALGFAVNPRGPDHLHTQCMAEFGHRPVGVELIEKITGDRKYANPYLTEKRAEIVRWHEDAYVLDDGLGFCSFATSVDFSIMPRLMAGFLRAATGMEVSEDETMFAGRRVVTLEKCFNVREGADRSDDCLPWRLMNEPSPDRPGAMNSKEELDGMLDEYYKAHGWDLRTSRPTREILKMLELDDVAEQLRALGRLPEEDAQ